MQDLEEKQKSKVESINTHKKALSNKKAELLSIIRNNDEYFNQFLSHVGIDKVDEFLRKQTTYNQSLLKISKLEDEIEQIQMEKRSIALRQLGFSEHIIRSLTYSRKCSLCLDNHDWDKIIILSCGHCFHGKCLKEVKRQTCPECRSVIQLPGMGRYGGSMLFAHHNEQEYDA